MCLFKNIFAYSENRFDFPYIATYIKSQKEHK